MPTNEVTMPRTIDAAAKQCSQLMDVHTATGWHLAAILATVVEPGAGQGTSRRTAGGRESASEFAARGIRGLKSENTVLRYVTLWTEHVGPRPKPGEVVKLPTTPWPPEAKNQGSRPSSDPDKAIEQVIAKHGADVFAQAVAANPVVDRVIEQTAASKPAAVIAHASTALHNQAQQRGPKLTWPSPGGYQRTARDDCDASIALIVRELRALRSQKQQLSQAERAEAADALREIGKTSDTLATYFETDAASIEAELAKLLKEEV
jgi:hypothetical protein